MAINNGKATIEDRVGFYSITIPSKKNWLMLIFGTAWLGAWVYGLIAAIQMLSSDVEGFARGFMIFWLAAWTTGGFAFITITLWGYFGKEILKIDRDGVHLEKTVFGIGIKKKLIRKEVKNFRFENTDQGKFGGNRWNTWGLGPGKIKFDYGFKTYSFALAVDDAEANYLVEKLNDRIAK